ncbi:hypothetical protein TNCV_3005871 [Trichonephila clavipes]|nr:hypothetical protein TNCV_3005871 [Trichonephila clavipes]
MKAKHLNWAKQWRDKDVDFWRSVFFKDESTFEILQKKAQFVRRRDGEKFPSDCCSDCETPYKNKYLVSHQQQGYWMSGRG